MQKTLEARESPKRRNEKSEQRRTTGDEAQPARHQPDRDEQDKKSSKKKSSKGILSRAGSIFKRNTAAAKQGGF